MFYFDFCIGLAQRVALLQVKNCMMRLIFWSPIICSLLSLHNSLQLFVITVAYITKMKQKEAAFILPHNSAGHISNSVSLPQRQLC